MEQPLVALGLHERLVTTGMQATLDAEAQLRVEIARSTRATNHTCWLDTFTSSLAVRWKAEPIEMGRFSS